MTGPIALTVPIAEAKPGDLVQTVIRRRSRNRVSDGIVEHVAVVDHRYGARNERLWLAPICGAKPGSVGSGDSGTPLCQVCERRLAAGGRPGFEQEQF